jgi:hypothetical protein
MPNSLLISQKRSLALKKLQEDQLAAHKDGDWHDTSGYEKDA